MCRCQPVRGGVLSKPLSLTLPPGVSAVRLNTPRGPLAALDGSPAGAAGSTATPAVLVPGFTGSKEDFLPALGGLLATGRRVLTYDQRGQYESPGPDDPACYSVQALADELLAVIEQVGPPVHLVGHSFGGLVARDLLIRRPDAARSFTLLDSGPAALGGNRKLYLELMTPLLQAEGLVGVYAAMEQLTADDPTMEGLPAEIREFLRRRFLGQSPVCVEVTCQALLAEPDRVDELRAAYPGPILVACGEGDDAWPPELQEEMARRLGAPFESIPDALHSPAAENPDVTVKVLGAFWDSAESSVESRP